MRLDGGSRRRAILPALRRCEVGVGVRFVVVAGCRSGAFRSEGSSWHDVRRTSLSGSLVQAGRPRADRRREAAPGIMCRMITVCDISALARWAEVGLLDRLGTPASLLQAGDGHSLMPLRSRRLTLGAHGWRQRRIALSTFSSPRRRGGFARAACAATFGRPSFQRTRSTSSRTRSSLPRRASASSR